MAAIAAQSLRQNQRINFAPTTGARIFLLQVNFLGFRHG
jgi:hypothetical protein